MGESRQAERLQQLFELARTARGWTRSQLADALGRDPSRIVPASGNPKLDIVVKLARVLEWPVGDVVEALYDVNSDDMDLLIGHTVDRGIEKQMEGKSADELYELALELSDKGEHHKALLVARRIRQVTHEPNAVAEALSFEAVSWMSLGRYVNALEACNSGLEIPCIPGWLQRNLQVNLAYALYLLWRLQLSLGLSDLLLRRLDALDDSEIADLDHRSMAHYIRGNVHRRLMIREPELRNHHIEMAWNDLDAVISLAESESADATGLQLNQRAIGAKLQRLEVDVEAGAKSARDATEQLLSMLDEYSDIAGFDSTVLEEIGWGCIAGCNIAVRHLRGDAKQRAFAIFSNKTLEIADSIGNWAFRERIFSLQHAIYSEIRDITGFDVPIPLEEDERAALVSVMGRFPQFQQTGWRLLEPAHSSRRW